MAVPDSARSRAAILQLTAERAGHCAFFFDFDGTLAPIQEDPDTVHPADGIVEVLAEVNRRLGKVVIVSARPADFLRQRFAALPDVASSASTAWRSSAPAAWSRPTRAPPRSCRS